MVWAGCVIKTYELSNLWTPRGCQAPGLRSWTPGSGFCINHKTLAKKMRPAISPPLALAALFRSRLGSSQDLWAPGESTAVCGKSEDTKGQHLP
jgi:hypothetical protein